MVANVGKHVAAVAQSLKNHPDAAVAICVALVAIPCITLAPEPWLVVAVAVAIFGGYCFLRVSSARHTERMAVTEIQKIEADRGDRLRAKAAARVKKDTAKSGSVVPVTRKGKRT